MQFTKFLLSSTLSCLPSLAAGSPVPEPGSDLAPRATTPTVPFQLSYLFTAHLSLGNPSKPINITGGVLEDEPILNGTVSGPALNATIKTGLAYPQVLENGTVDIAQIVLYGSATDGTPFSISEMGVGSEDSQVTRIEFSIGGGTKYKSLRDGYVLASVNRTSTTGVSVEGYLVTISK